ncbi:hypothetical protein IW261DRAFT_273807 [Armillaria novae-zelandiae]|uniref:Uncharacterized protein n=1 Tax=Armillaria novae-zelandiae TaxID=153914 RepID=A0AA39N880_9AGAR|nr:hypothetical protein IW261DRAFT_273807 [Armillaria novae-zelandiae]
MLLLYQIRASTNRPIHDTLPVAKFLGVYTDAGLWWKEQSAAAIKQEDDWIIQFQHLGRVSSGVSRESMRLTYISIAIPRIATLIIFCIYAVRMRLMILMIHLNRYVWIYSRDKQRRQCRANRKESGIYI